MAYTWACVDGLYVLRWGARPEFADAARFLKEIAESRRTHQGPLVGLFVVPADSEAPSDENFSLGG
jgi:hypothetical protein